MTYRSSWRLPALGRTSSYSGCGQPLRSLAFCSRLPRKCTSGRCSEVRARKPSRWTSSPGSRPLQRTTCGGRSATTPDKGGTKRNERKEGRKEGTNRIRLNRAEWNGKLNRTHSNGMEAMNRIRLNRAKWNGMELNRTDSNGMEWNRIRPRLNEIDPYHQLEPNKT